MIKRKLNKGFTLVEVLVSMIIMSLIAIMLSSVILPVARNSSTQRGMYVTASQAKSALDEEILKSIQKSERYNKAKFSAVEEDKPKMKYSNRFGIAEINGYPVTVGRLHTFVSSGYRELPIPTATNKKLIIKGSAEKAPPFAYLYDKSQYTLEGSTLRSSGTNIPYGIYGLFYRSLRDSENKLNKPMTSEEVMTYNPRFKNDFVLLPGNSKIITLMDYLNQNDEAKVKADNDLSETEKTITYSYDFTTSIDYEDRDLVFSAIPLGTNTYMGSEIPAETPVHMIGLPVLDGLAAHYDASLVLKKESDGVYIEDPTLKTKALVWEDVRKYTGLSNGTNFVFNITGLKLQYTDFGKTTRFKKTDLAGQMTNKLFDGKDSRTMFMRINTGIKPASGDNRGNLVLLSSGKVDDNTPDSFRLYIDESNQKLIIDRVVQVRAMGQGPPQLLPRKETYGMDLKKPYSILGTGSESERKGFEILRIDAKNKDLTVSLLSSSGENSKIKLNSDDRFRLIDSSITVPQGYSVQDPPPLELTSFSFTNSISEVDYEMGGIVGGDTSGLVDISDMVYYNKIPKRFDSSDYSKDVSAYLFRKYLTESEFETLYK